MTAAYAATARRRLISRTAAVPRESRPKIAAQVEGSGMSLTAVKPSTAVPAKKSEFTSVGEPPEVEYSKTLPFDSTNKAEPAAAMAVIFDPTMVELRSCP
jgi:hypothetical protein